MEFSRQGFAEIRALNLKVSSNNDTETFPFFGGGKDQGKTGGIILGVQFGPNGGVFEFGYQSHTGTFFDKDDFFLKGGVKYRKQTAWQQMLNKASTFAQYSIPIESYGSTEKIIGLRFDRFTTGWLQDYLHDKPGRSNTHFLYNGIGNTTLGTQLFFTQ